MTRRDMLKRIGAIAGAAAGIPITAEIRAQARAQGLAAAGEALVSLTPLESRILRAMLARLMPADDNGPGALEARADRYIDRALAGALRAQRPAYAAGLAALDDYARRSKGSSFAELSSAGQDAVLTDVQYGRAAGFTNASQFFDLVRGHMIQGTFSDPFYGGNASFIGWDLIGYPGARIVVAANQQRMNVKPESSRKGAYDYAMFSRGEI